MNNTILIIHFASVIPGAVVRRMNVGARAFGKDRGCDVVKKEKIP